MQTGRRVGAFALRRLRAVFVSAQRPGDGVQNARFPLVVIAADNGQAVECRYDLNGLDALYIFSFQLDDLYRHFNSSSNLAKALCSISRGYARMPAGKRLYADFARVQAFSSARLARITWS